MIYKLPVTIPAVALVEISDNIPEEDQEAEAEELFLKKPRLYQIDSYNGDENICDPKDAVIT